MICPKCGRSMLSIFNGYSCFCGHEVKSGAQLDPSLARTAPVKTAYAHPEAVAWLMERCPHQVAPGTGHIEMQMPPDGVAFVKLIAAAIEHGRSLGPKIEAEDKTPEAATQDRFEMLEFDQ